MGSGASKVHAANEVVRVAEGRPIKTLVVGPPRAGKSALFRRILHNRFETRHTATDRIDVGVKLSRCDNAEVVSFEVRLHTVGVHLWAKDERRAVETRQLFVAKPALIGALFVLAAARDACRAAPGLIFRPLHSCGTRRAMAMWKWAARSTPPSARSSLSST